MRQESSYPSSGHATAFEVAPNVEQLKALTEQVVNLPDDSPLRLDFVADSLNANIRSWAATRYKWVRVQSPLNPRFWSTVANASA